MHRLDSFRELLNDCRLLDLPSHGCAYTWSNNRVGDALVKERLDRAVCNAEWRVSYPNAQVLALPLKLSGTRIPDVNQLLKPPGTQPRQGTLLFQ